MFPASLRGLSLAIERYRTAAQDPASSAEDVFIPLSEALSWAFSVDDALLKLRDDTPERQEHRRRYTAARAADPKGPYVVGLRFARNRCTHQLALVAERGHLAPPLRPPITVGLVFRWRPVAELPEASSGQDHGKGEYVGYLAGDAAENTLQYVTDWLYRAVEQFVS